MAGWVWNDEAVEALKGLAGTMSVTEIAAELSVKFREHVSRNAVIGKIHRLGLQQSQRAPRPRIEKPKADKMVKIRKPPAERAAPEVLEVPAFLEAAESPPLADDVVSVGVDYLKNPPWGCKQIIGKIGSDGLQMCCGQPRGMTERGGDSAYCPAHHRINNVPRALQEKRWRKV